jgi:hypothetical protein
LLPFTAYPDRSKRKAFSIDVKMKTRQLRTIVGGDKNSGKVPTQ